MPLAAASTGAEERAFTPITDAMLQDPRLRRLIRRRTLDGRGYSPLDQIDRDSVDDLRMM